MDFSINGAEEESDSRNTVGVDTAPGETNGATGREYLSAMSFSVGSNLPRD